MTRFARAKGSKSSNEREPEEATPWSQMVQGITQKRDLEDLEEQEMDLGSDCEGGGHTETSIDEEEDEDSEKEEKSRKRKFEFVGGNQALQENEDENVSKKKKRVRPKDKCLNCKVKGHRKMECPELSEERRKELSELVQMKIERKGKGTGRKKKKKQDKNLDSEQDKEENKSEENKTVDKKVKKGPKHKNAEKKAKDAKYKKELKDKTGQVVQEGEGLFQGFRVKKEDVKRLQLLRKKLFSDKEHKLTHDQVEEALKKERRRAENELARSKKMVCYNCRKPGHFISDCPQKEETDAKTLKTVGQCFKCGSFDHTSKECKSKLKGGDAFKFAVCFICNESGHLAKSCPDNPKGLYPKGGSCRFCGSVEHLKSECPRKTEKDDREEIKIGRINDNVELEPERIKSFKKTGKEMKKKKLVKF